MNEEAAARQVVRFIAAGALNTAFSYAAYLALLGWLGYAAAYAVAYVVGLLTQYVLHGRYVFRVALRWRSLLGYPAIHLVLYAYGAALLWLLVDRIGLSAHIVPLIVIAATIPPSFLLTRAWLARSDARRDDAREGRA